MTVGSVNQRFRALTPGCDGYDGIYDVGLRQVRQSNDDEHSRSPQVFPQPADHHPIAANSAATSVRLRMCRHRTARHWFETCSNCSCRRSFRICLSDNLDILVPPFQQLLKQRTQQLVNRIQTFPVDHFPNPFKFDICCNLERRLFLPIPQIDYEWENCHECFSMLSRGNW